VTSHKDEEFSLATVVRDAFILGTFTGSWVSKYAEGQIVKGSPLSTIPFNVASGINEDHPIVLMLHSFSFFSSTRLEGLSTLAHLASYVKIYFRYQNCPGIWTSHICSYTLIPILPSTSRGQGHQTIVYPSPMHQYSNILLVTNLSIKGSTLLVQRSDEILTAQGSSPDPPRGRQSSTSVNQRYIYTLPVSLCMSLRQAFGLERRVNYPSTPLEFGHNQVLHLSGSISSQRGGSITLLVSLSYISP